jgi:hypothetical protein
MKLHAHNTHDVPLALTALLEQLYALVAPDIVPLRVISSIVAHFPISGVSGTLMRALDCVPFVSIVATPVS